MKTPSSSHRKKTTSHKRSCTLQIRGSIVVSISACHADDPGSIPGRGVPFTFCAWDMCEFRSHGICADGPPLAHCASLCRGRLVSSGAGTHSWLCDGSSWNSSRGRVPLGRLGRRRICLTDSHAELLSRHEGPHRLVVRTSRCGRDNPGSTPGAVMHGHPTTPGSVDTPTWAMAQ